MPKMKTHRGAAKRFRKSKTGLLLESAIPASTARDVMADAAEAGAAGVRDLTRAGTSGRHPGNSCRDVIRRLLRRTAWPARYFAPIPTWHPKADEERVVQLPFLLPQELLAFILQCPGALPKVLAKSDASPELFRQAAAVAREVGADSSLLVPLGLHGNGAPFNNPRVRSLEFFAMSFPALQQEGPALRLPIAAVERTSALTFHSIRAVLQWSLRMCARGLYPLRRHDRGRVRTPICPSEAGRKAFGCQSSLGGGPWRLVLYGGGIRLGLLE